MSPGITQMEEQSWAPFMTGGENSVMLSVGRLIRRCTSSTSSELSVAGLLGTATP